MTSPKPHAVLVLNPLARAGRGLRRWPKIEKRLAAHWDLTIVSSGRGLSSALKAALEKGDRSFIVAGGDGSLHDFLNALIPVKGDLALSEITLGAIGLGSSNDFHKPITERLEGVSVKAWPGSVSSRDVGVAVLSSPGEEPREVFFLVSASLGLVAEANRFFNSKERVLSFLKKTSMDLAIVYSALRTLARFRPIRARFLPPSGRFEAELTSLQVMKTPFVSGSFRFTESVSPDDGQFSVHALLNLGFWRTLKAMAQLSLGSYRSSQEPSFRRHWRTSRFIFESGKPVTVELDGEIYSASRVEFRVFHERIGVYGALKT